MDNHGDRGAIPVRSFQTPFSTLVEQETTLDYGIVVFELFALALLRMVGSLELLE